MPLPFVDGSPSWTTTHALKLGSPSKKPVDANIDTTTHFVNVKKDPVAHESEAKKVPGLQRHVAIGFCLQRDALLSLVAHGGPEKKLDQTANACLEGMTGAPAVWSTGCLVYVAKVTTTTEQENTKMSSVLQDVTSELNIEQIYQKKSQLEHILLHPDTYVGSVEYTDREVQWVYDAEKESIVQREISYVPALYKIFDEILVNAADNKQRDPKMDKIRINIDKERNEISVYNNGKGVPVVMHKEEKLYLPELIFGTLLTSSNYIDDEKKVTGGRNGFGAKLCNVFSSKFTLETSTKAYGKRFKQTWKDNMAKDKDCDISKATGEDFTKVTFTPDLAKFKMTQLDDDIIVLMYRRAFDIAGYTKDVKVFLNEKEVPVHGFKQYVEFYMKSVFEGDEAPKLVHEVVNHRWEVALAISDKGFQQVSFANSIATTKGGRHVDFVTDQIVSKLTEVVKKKTAKGGFKVKPFQVKNHMWVFVNALIENPTFDSQTKETMTL
ncbi:hypothetical protein L596_017294 [Steinernema carpocapsae]|uniref:DNA topoisomerase 2 n=1 Tax=Steinernema carpocapsae TaxID=34508 RepID=A0A4U5N185_STECR|nr:hypothetical protein L596_017294 [Steinernema carpocapsae]